MKVIKGFKQAKEALSRRDPSSVLETDEKTVRQIIDDVRKRGDKALHFWTSKYDGVSLSSFKVGKTEIAKAYDEVGSELLSAMKLAARRIASFHIRQKRLLLRESVKGSAGWLVRPLNRVGINAPGFRAPLPSSVLMTAILAKISGVREVIIVTPPRKGGVVSPTTLVAADIAGVDNVYSVGGAQAIAALAFGTESIPRVDKVFGPGNKYVTLAKKMLYGTVGIDGLFGTSELLVIADKAANPEYCAADLIAQAEHDPLVSSILVTTSQNLADRVIREVDRQLNELSHPDLARKSLEERGIVAVVASIDEAIELANLYAPEHLLLLVTNADSYLSRIYNAGCIVLGEKGTVALGDYIAGPSHVLPTGGTARFSSPLNITDFVKLTSLINVDDALLKKLGPAAQTLATAEGLQAHAKAVERRLT